MDPNTALDAVRAFTARVINGQRVSATDAQDAAEAFDALDQWLSRGAFLPAAWAYRPESHDMRATPAIVQC